VEVLCGLNPQSNAPSQEADGIRRFGYYFAKAVVRVFVIVVIVFVAMIFPSFDRIMALVGSSLCFTICIILPLTFYLKIFGEEVPFGERVVDWMLIVVSTIMAVIGTIWAFLPKESL
jgi:vesicular inhibitory amino acid transporter